MRTYKVNTWKGLQRTPPNKQTQIPGKNKKQNEEARSLKFYC